MELPKIKRMLNPEASTNDKRKLEAGKEPVDKDSKRQKREEGQRIEARGAVLKLSGKCSACFCCGDHRRKLILKIRSLPFLLNVLVLKLSIFKSVK